MRTTARSGTPRRAVALLAAAAMTLAALLGAAVSGPTARAVTTATNLGPALETVNVRSAAFAELPDGKHVVYATSNGEPATFTMVDVLTGERLFATPIEGATLGGFVAVAPDGMVYFTARSPMNGGLFSFDPLTHELTHIAADIFGQRVLYDGTFDDDGTLYFGTYPDAKVVSYDPGTGELRDYGTQTEDAAYVFGLGVVDGEIWAGTGPVPHLYRIDPDSGERTEMHPPEHVMEGADWFISIEPRDDLVFVRLSPRGTYDMAVYNRTQDRWLQEVVAGTFDTAVTEPARGNRAYFLQGDVLTGYHLSSERTFATGFEGSEIHSAMSDAVGTYRIAVLDLPGYPGDTVVGINTDGNLWRYNLPTRSGELVPADILGSPAGAHSMGLGPDGAVYMGAYLSSGVLSRIDPLTQQIEQMRGPKQGDTIIGHDDRLVVSSYPGAVVHVGDPGETWSTFDKVLELGRGAPNYQDRIVAMASAGERVAVGSVPDYGQLGGALTIVDPETGDHEFHRNVVADQSVVSLVYRDGLIFGGTSVHGGLSTEPSQDEAELFVWDVTSGTRVFSDVVVPGAEVIGELVLGPDGLVRGLTDTGVVFSFDPESFAVSGMVDTGLTTTNSWGLATALHYRAADDAFYGVAGGALFRLQRGAAEHEVLVPSGVRRAALDGQGRVYYATDIDVYRLD